MIKIKPEVFYHGTSCSPCPLGRAGNSVHYTDAEVSAVHGQTAGCLAAAQTPELIRATGSKAEFLSPIAGSRLYHSTDCGFARPVEAHSGSGYNCWVFSILNILACSPGFCRWRLRSSFESRRRRIHPRSSIAL